jgi:bacterioferritin
MPAFTSDLESIRSRARRKIEDGAVTEAYKGDKEKTIQILNDALATEIVCVLRYMHHYFMATGVHAMSVRDEFKEHADAEREHADEIADRIQQLGGRPDFNPKSLLERSASQYVEGSNLSEMIKEDLIAERIVIEVYSDMIRYFGDNDSTTRIMIEKILRDEEEHASDLSDLLYVIDPHTGATEGQDPGTEPLRYSGEKSRESAKQTANVTSQLQKKNGRGQAPQSGVRQNQPLQPMAKEGTKSGARAENPADKNWKIAKPKNRKPAA